MIDYKTEKHEECGEGFVYCALAGACFFGSLFLIGFLLYLLEV